MPNDYTLKIFLVNMLFFVERIQATLVPLVVGIETKDYTLRRRLSQLVNDYTLKIFCWVILFFLCMWWFKIRAGGPISTSSCFIWISPPICGNWQMIQKILLGTGQKEKSKLLHSGFLCNLLLSATFILVLENKTWNCVWKMKLP